MDTITRCERDPGFRRQRHKPVSGKQETPVTQAYTQPVAAPKPIDTAAPSEMKPNHFMSVHGHLAHPPSVAYTTALCRRSSLQIKSAGQRSGPGLKEKTVGTYQARETH